MRSTTATLSALLLLTTTILIASCSTTKDPLPVPSAKQTAAGTLHDRTIPLPPKAYPTAMAYADDGSLWVTEKSIGGVARIDAQDHVQQYRIPGESNDPSGILQGPDSEMWFIGFEVIGKLDTSGQMTGWQTGARSSLGLPVSFTTGPDGSVWYTESGTPSIRRVSADQQPQVVATLPNSIYYTFPATGITTGPDRAVWFSMVNTNQGPDIIARVDTSGRVSTWNLPPATTPWGIVGGLDGALWFSERTGIGRITVAGQISHYPVAGDQRPQDIVAGPDGNLWFTTPTQLGRITVAGQVTMTTVPGARALRAILPALDGGFWIADTSTDTIHHFTPN